MGRYYFLTYKTEQKKEPFILPEELRREILNTEGIRIYHESDTGPCVIVNADEKSIEKIRELESILKIDDDFECRAFEGYL